MSSTIVVAVDFSDATTSVLDAAAREASLRPGAQLHALHVVRPPSLFSGSASEPGFTVDLSGVLICAREELERWLNLSGLVVISHVRVGNPAEEINVLAIELGADLVVVGASTKGLARSILLGSTTHALLGKCECSVFLVRPGAPAIDAPRDSQNDDVHKRHHPIAHTYQAPDSLSAHFGEGSNRIRH